MAGNRHLPHVKFLFVVALSSSAASITLLQPYLLLSFSDLAVAGTFWWAATAAQVSTVHSTAQDQWRQDNTATGASDQQLCSLTSPPGVSIPSATRCAAGRPTLRSLFRNRVAPNGKRTSGVLQAE